MTRRFGIRGYLLALCCMLMGAIEVAGQGNQVQQSSRVTRDSLSSHAAVQRPRQGASHPSSLSTSHVSSMQQSRVETNHSSQPHPHIASAGRTPYEGSHGGGGGADLRFANANRYQTQTPGMGHGSTVTPGTLAAGKLNHTQVGPQNSHQLLSTDTSDRQSGADQAARAGATPTSMRGGNSSRSQARPDSSSRPNQRQR